MEPAPANFRPGLRLALKIALRELRGGLRGFYIFLGCIALGVAAITGVNSVAYSISQGISHEGRAILGGDLSFALSQGKVNADQQKFLETFGTVSTLVTMRAMSRKTDGSDQTLIELKAVDENYPLYGQLLVDDVPAGGDQLSPTDALVDVLLLDRLGLSSGNKIEIGEAEFTITGTITREPDRAGAGLGFGPKVIVSIAGLSRSGLVQPGSLLHYHYKVRLDNPDAANVAAMQAQAHEKFPKAGWRVRTRDNAAPALSRSVERFSQFLTLVGLTALIVGGVGVANAIRAFLETKRPVIASLKSLGAPGGFVFNVYLLQILLLASFGILLGLIMGALMPFAARVALSDLVPVSQGFLFFPGALIPGIAYGYLTALAFAIWPLAVSRDIQPTDLFRASTYGGGRNWPRPAYLVVLAAIVFTLIFLAIYLAGDRFIASVFVGAIAVAFLALRLVSFAIQWLAKSAPSFRIPELRMAIANIHRPGSLTPSVIISLGLGLALLVALAAIDGNLRRQIGSNIPNEAPDFFFLDIQNNQIDAFKSKLSELAGGGKIISVPMLRGRVTALRGIPAADYQVSGGGEWVLRGDRGITYTSRVPENSTLKDGEWWPQDYDGPPLVSVSAEEAGELSLNVGDILTFNVLGRVIEARIASLRNVEWETLGINFVFVFSPNTFANAPHSYLATLKFDQNAENPDNGVLLRGLAKSFPAVTSVHIRDALETVNRLVGQLSTAIRVAASVALFASVLVLAGALAAGNRERVHDAVVFKTLGATRKSLMAVLVYEYAILGFATAIFAVFAGSAAAWFVISGIMGFKYVVLPGIAAATLIAALLFTIGLGLTGTWRILGQKAGPILREL